MNSFEKITGKVLKGDAGKLEGLCKMYLDAGYKRAIVKIPVEMMDIDSRYQTEVRTARDLSYLTKGWDERKLTPLLVVPHWTEGKAYIVDGYGRWVAGQIVDPARYKDMDCIVLFDVPDDPVERLQYEAELYAFQNKQVSKMTPIQRHGAMLCLNDMATKKLEDLSKTYHFVYVNYGGNREASVVGSYTEVLALCALNNGTVEYVFDILNGAGFDRKTNGYATYMLRALRDMYRLYNLYRPKTKEFLIEKLRGMDPITVKSMAVAKYPMLAVCTAVSLYVEDMLVDGTCLAQRRRVVNNRVQPLTKTA